MNPRVEAFANLLLDQLNKGSAELRSQGIVLKSNNLKVISSREEEEDLLSFVFDNEVTIEDNGFKGIYPSSIFFVSFRINTQEGRLIFHYSENIVPFELGEGEFKNIKSIEVHDKVLNGPDEAMTFFFNRLNLFADKYKRYRDWKLEHFGY